ncbi:hypothetical protein ACRALDRAFT_206570 [Sodiomyces alcalophilus JCM 7366]|uniref:uncharacterized protein n=1 Tax=Sodiomyces alcalophilus JCM 7366 TaxID=591952 RepID=UPI0039B3C51F
MQELPRQKWGGFDEFVTFTLCTKYSYISHSQYLIRYSYCRLPLQKSPPPHKRSLNPVRTVPFVPFRGRVGNRNQLLNFPVWTIEYWNLATIPFHLREEKGAPGRKESRPYPVISPVAGGNEESSPALRFMPTRPADCETRRTPYMRLRTYVVRHTLHSYNMYTTAPAAADCHSSVVCSVDHHKTLASPISITQPHIQFY